MIETLIKITDKQSKYTTYYYNTHEITSDIYTQLEHELTQEYGDVN